MGWGRNLRRAVAASGVALATLLSADVAGGAEITSPRGESLAYDANASRNGVANEPAVFGPLEQAWTRPMEGLVGQPLVVDDTLLANVSTSNNGGGCCGYGSEIVAMNPRTGAVRWRAATPGTYFSAPIAAGDGVVVSVNYQGQVRAFRISDGAPLWSFLETVDTPRGANLVVDDGSVYVSSSTAYSNAGPLYAFDLATGRLLWKVDRHTLSPGDDKEIALDDELLFTASECGSVIARSRATGAVVWSRIVDPGHTCFSGDAIVDDGVVYAGSGYSYDAATGVPRPLGPEVDLAAVDGDFGFWGDGGFNRAYRLPIATPVWETEYRRTDEAAKPLVVGGTVYTASAFYADYEVPLTGYERTTGDILYEHQLPDPGYVNRGGTDPGLTAGAKHLFVAQGYELTAMRPLLDPPPRGIDLLPEATDLPARSRLPIDAGLGESIRRSDALVELDGDVFPNGASSGDALRLRRTADDGVARFDIPVDRNVHLSVSSGSSQGEELDIYAYPELKVTATEVKPRRVRVRAKVTRLDREHLEGREMHAYTVPPGSNVLTRRDSEPLEIVRTGAGVARMFFDPRGLVAGTRVVVCGEDFPQDGFGRLEGLARDCGQSIYFESSAGRSAHRADAVASIEPRLGR